MSIANDKSWKHICLCTKSLLKKQKKDDTFTDNDVMNEIVDKKKHLFYRTLNEVFISNCYDKYK